MTDLHLHPLRTERRGLLGERGACPAVGGVHRHAVAEEQTGRRDAALAEADDRHLAPGAAPLLEHQRTFSVARATSAQRMPRIQNRMTTVVSAQPCFSK